MAIAGVTPLHQDGKICPSCNQHMPANAYGVRRSGKRTGDLIVPCTECRVKSHREMRTPSRYRKIEWPSKLKTIYGITADDYYQILADQGGGCAICGSLTPQNKRTDRFCVDHCHQTGFIRGLLCTPCNRALGLFQDNPERLEAAADYLKLSKGNTPGG